MKVLSGLSILAAFCLTTAAQQAKKMDYGLPELHRISTVTLSPSYSCRERAQFSTGYANTALFLSDYSKSRNNPDLLFNGACGAEDYFDASSAGADMALITDLGEDVPIEQLSASKSFNLQRVAKFDAYSKFIQETPVHKGHTYAVLLNKSDLRGLFVFTVTDHAPNQSVIIRYAVKMYDIFPNSVRSEGFDWEAGNKTNL